jgi:hypothetical protein
MANRNFVDGISTTTGFQNATGGNAKRDRNGSLVGNLYYNANIVCMPPYGTNASEYSCAAIFSDARNVEVLKSNAANYNLSLIRCALSTKDLPVFIPIVCPNPDDPSDVNYLNYRVGVQLRVAGSAYRALPGAGTGESGVPMYIGQPSITSPGWSPPRITFYPVPASTATGGLAIGDSVSPVMIPWNLPITTFKGVLAQVGSGGWIGNMLAGVGSSSYTGTQQSLSFGVVKIPTQSAVSSPGAVPTPGGSGAFLTITNTLASTLPSIAPQYSRITLDFSVHGSYDPSAYAKAFGIPVGTVITLEQGSTYVAPLGITTGPGVFDFTLTAYTNLKWVPEDLSIAPPGLPPNATGPPSQEYYYWSYNIPTFLDNVVNPAIAKALSGPPLVTGVAATNLSRQSAETQKAAFLKALTSGPKAWNALTLYQPGDMCYYPAPSNTVVGVAYVAQAVSLGTAPPSATWAILSASTVPIIASSNTTEQWTAGLTYLKGAGAIYGGNVYVALQDAVSDTTPPTQLPLFWAKVGLSLLNSWTTSIYPTGSYVTYQGNDFVLTGVDTTYNAPPINSAWSPLTGGLETGLFLQNIQADTLVASNPPVFSYDASNLFTLQMDTYSVNGAEDSLGLSGGVTIASKAQYMWPCFESLNLVSDLSFAALFSGFDQTTYSLSRPVPVVWGGVNSVDPTKTVPPTLALPDFSTTLASAVGPPVVAGAIYGNYPSLPAYAGRLSRLGLTQALPLNAPVVTQPNFGMNSSFPSFMTPIVQQYESTSTTWCPIDSIVVTTADIPLKKELVGNPSYIPASSPAGNATQSGNNVAQILTDFSVALQNANDYRSFIIYIPTGEYRRISMKETGLFQNISFQLWWRNRISQQLIPVTLSPGGSCNLKFLFEPIQ